MFTSRKSAGSTPHRVQVSSYAAIVAAAALTAAAFSAPVSAAVSLNTNLITDGDAESAAGSSDGSTVVVPGWTTANGFTAVQYGASGGFPATTDPGPTNRGLNFFAGGPDSTTATASQVIDISSVASQIDAGSLSVDLSGYFGGFEDQNDNAVLSAEFISAGNSSLGSASVGGVSAADRNNATGLLFRDQTGAVPAGTRTIDLTITSIRTDGTYNDGYADNLSLELTSGPPSPPVTSVPLPAAAWPGLAAIGCIGMAGVVRRRRSAGTPS